MDSQIEWVIPLAEVADSDETFTSGKAAKLAQLARAGFYVSSEYLGIVTVGAPEFDLEDVSFAASEEMQ